MLSGLIIGWLTGWLERSLSTIYSTNTPHTHTHHSILRLCAARFVDGRCAGSHAIRVRQCVSMCVCRCTKTPPCAGHAIGGLRPLRHACLKYYTRSDILMRRVAWARLPAPKRVVVVTGFFFRNASVRVRACVNMMGVRVCVRSYSKLLSFIGIRNGGARD